MKLPVEPAPRLLRLRLIKTLRRAWLGPGNRTAALAEGTAEYAGVAFVARTLAGWNAPREAIRKQAKDLIDAKDYGSVAVDVESYSIGLYAGLLLEEIGPPGWQQRAEAAPLADVLLEKVTPVVVLASPSPEDRALVAASIDKVNARFAGRAEAIARDWLAGKRFVAIPESAFQNSVGVEMFASTADLPKGAMIELGLSGIADINGAVTIRADSLTGWLDVCGDFMRVIRIADLDAGLIPVGAVEHRIQDGGTVICLAGKTLK